MDLRGVDVPVDDPGIEAECSTVVIVQQVPQGQQAIQAVNGLALGVGPVQVDISLGPVDQFALLVESGSYFSLSATHGEHVEHLLGAVEHRAGSL